MSHKFLRDAELFRNPEVRGLEHARYIVFDSHTNPMVTLKEKLAIGHIADFFGTRLGSMRYKKILQSYGLKNIPEGNKTVQLAHTLRLIYQKENTEIPSFLNMLIRKHKLGTKELAELGSYLTPLGLKIEGKSVTAIPSEDDFMTFLAQSLRNPKPVIGAQGERDPAIVTLCEKISSLISEFTLVDYGCGEGRLIYGLISLDQKLLSMMTYIGVDRNVECLKKTRRNISSTGFNKMVKECKLMEPDYFFKMSQAVDFIFMINVLHEIHLHSLIPILIELERKLKKDGHLVIHEMRELTEGELGFVAWQSEDFVRLFENTSFKPYLHPYRTKRGIPLINADLVKVKDESTEPRVFENNCLDAFNSKIEWVDKELDGIRKEGEKSKRYAFLLVLKDNVESQLKIFHERARTYSLDSMDR
jgi:SAM-dependent methyltransferase